MDSKLIKLTGVWMQKTKSGDSFMAGKVNQGMSLLIFKNKNKRPGTNDPDYNAFLAPIEKQETQQAQPQQDNDIPF